MHTIVLISSHPSIDMNMRRSLETLFPECRIEVVHVREGQNREEVLENQKGVHVHPKPFPNK
jgi:hypothetical protein